MDYVYIYSQLYKECIGMAYIAFVDIIRTCMLHVRTYSNVKRSCIRSVPFCFTVDKRVIFSPFSCASQ